MPSVKVRVVPHTGGITTLFSLVVQLDRKPHNKKRYNQINMKKFIVSHVWWLTLVFAVAMLFAHSFSSTIIKVDNTSIILLVVIALSPFISAITKIKIGDFEAEIDPEEVKRIKEDVYKQASDADESMPNLEMDETVQSIKQLVETDYILALAKLRIELEKVLSKLYRATHKEETVQRPQAAGQLIAKLSNSEIVPTDVARSTREVLSLCNRAIHGEEIRQQDAVSVVEAGSILLYELSFTASDYVLKPAEVIEINPLELDMFINAKYRVTTITPTVEMPKKNIRIVDQEGLNELVKGYENYAEFIVQVEKIDGT